MRHEQVQPLLRELKGHAAAAEGVELLEHLGAGGDELELARAVGSQQAEDLDTMCGGGVSGDEGVGEWRG